MKIQRLQEIENKLDIQLSRKDGTHSKEYWMYDIQSVELSEIVKELISYKRQIQNMVKRNIDSIHDEVKNKQMKLKCVLYTDMAFFKSNEPCKSCDLYEGCEKKDVEYRDFLLQEVFVPKEVV